MERKRILPSFLMPLFPLCLLLPVLLLAACSQASQGGAGTESPDRVGEILYEHVMAQNDTLTAENRDLKVQISRLEVRARELRGLSLSFREADVSRVRVREDASLLWMPSGDEMPVGVVAAGSLLSVTVEGTDEDGVVWLLACNATLEADQAPVLAGWIRQDRTEPAVGADASSPAGAVGDAGAGAVP